MAEIAIELFTGARQIVSDVQFVLPGVKECIVVVALREVALRRPGIQTLFCLVANRAGLLWLRRKLGDVALDAGLVAGEFQPQLFVAIGGLNDAFRKVLAVWTFVA